MKVRGRGGRLSQGSTGECVCPNCGYRVPHYLGVSCYKQTCPKCGGKMTEEDTGILRY